MSNQSNQSNVAAAAKSPAFKATFIAANNGLQTEQRVHGRRAFPSNKGPQPQLGQTWMVEVAGENPKGTVHFVKCLELVSAAPVAEVSKPTVIVAKPEPVKHIPVVRAPGNDVFARIAAWAAPSKTVALGDLKFAFAKKRVESDETARSMFTKLGSAMATTKALQEIADNAEGQLKQVNSNDHDIGLALFEARKVMAQMEVDKANLVKETLAYARLVAKLNKQLKVAPDDQLAQLVATTKETLDSKRASHNASMATAKEQLNHANTGVFFCYHEDTVKAVLEQLATKANYSEQATSHRLQLEAELSAFEQHVATLT